jgi:hypothetical protein
MGTGTLAKQAECVDAQQEQRVLVNTRMNMGLQAVAMGDAFQLKSPR